MGNILIPLIHTLNSGFRTRAALPAEIPALRNHTGDSDTSMKNAVWFS
jgi:hypothetical protein